MMGTHFNSESVPPSRACGLAFTLWIAHHLFQPHIGDQTPRNSDLNGLSTLLSIGGLEMPSSRSQLARDRA
jgi:hypothetical protein